jgi:hypothetical protein
MLGASTPSTSRVRLDAMEWTFDRSGRLRADPIEIAEAATE